MTDQNIGTDGDTDNTTTTNNDQAETTYSQKEVDDMMARTKTSVTRKLNKQYEDLGDIDSLRTLVTDAETRQHDADIAKGDFDKILKDVVQKKDEKITSLENTVRGYTVNSPLLNAAATHRSINPEQVRSLLADKVKLDTEGVVQVIDGNNVARYNDSGAPLTVDELVVEFLDTNPHFVQPTRSTTNTNSSNDSTSIDQLDVSKLDMKDPKHRAKYAKYRKEHGLA
mgnify:CR=1 FL=1